VDIDEHPERLGRARADAKDLERLRMSETIIAFLRVGGGSVLTRGKKTQRGDTK